MATELFFRNPHNYIRELVECGVGNIAWDRGILVKKRIDPVKHAHTYFGMAIEYRILVVGEQGTADLRPGDTLDKPTGVYPTWKYGEEQALLEEMVARPIGEDEKVCSDTSLPGDERPVLGQEHRVVIIDPPNAGTGPGRRFLVYLKELQEDYPDCIIHVHGLYGFRPAFGMGFRSADISPREAAQHGKIMLPQGREEKYERVQKQVKWVTAMGFKPAELAEPRNRCIYNIKSAIWASQNFAELIKFRTVNDGAPVDTTSSDVEYVPRETKSIFNSGAPKKQDGDRFACDSCSLTADCKYYRAGAVCSVPGSEPTELAAYFRTRDSATIIEGLGVLLSGQARRVERAAQEEVEYGETDPEVTKMMGQLFDSGVKLAKLVDPALRANAAVQVNIGAGGQAAPINPKQAVAAAFRELELQGFSREQITPDMVAAVLQGKPIPSIPGELVEGTG